MICTKDISEVTTGLHGLNVLWRDGETLEDCPPEERMEKHKDYFLCYEDMGARDRYLLLAESVDMSKKELQEGKVTAQEFINYIKEDYERNGRPDEDGLSREDALIGLFTKIFSR